MMNKFSNIVLLMAAIFFSAMMLSAEPREGASLSGYVVDTENGETLIGATVFIKGTKLGAYTNKSGYYAVTGIPAGEYTVRVTNVGYKPLEQRITLDKNQSLRRKFELEPSAVMTKEISVEADRQEDKRQITISSIEVPIKNIKKIRIGGEADIFRSLQYLPGILTSSQLSSGLFVRGGSPDQNLVLLDGSTVYNPTHLFGFISTFNPDAIKDVELIKGGFQAEYGGRLSAVLNITQKEGNKKKIEGDASLGIISSRASVEGPLGNGSWFIGGRRTYFELIKELLPDDPDTPIPDFNFYDFNGKITQSIGQNDKLSLSGFVSADNLAYDGFGLGVDLNVGNQTAALMWTHIFSDNLFSKFNLSASTYDNSLSGEQSGYYFLFDNSITDYTLKGSLEWFTSEIITHKFGFESANYTFRYKSNFSGEEDSTAQTGVAAAGSTNLKVTDWNHSAYAQVNLNATDRISIQTGLRANYYEMNKDLTFDPRIALRYQYSTELAFKGAFGIFHQNLRLASQPDFSFFDTWLPSDSTVPVSRAIHYILSMESEPFEEFDFNVDVYYKRLYNISEINRYILKAETAGDIFFVGDAESYGLEFFLQKKYGRFTGWAGYALGFISAWFDEINNGEPFRPKFDRRHDFKIVLQYELDEHWDFGATFIFQSGQSYTGATSRFQLKMPEQGSGRGIVIPSERYGLRLPPSHQLNFNASYSFTIGNLPARVILDIFNVYNRRDIWFRYYDTRGDDTEVKDIELLPILPSLSFEIEF